MGSDKGTRPENDCVWENGITWEAIASLVIAGTFALLLVAALWGAGGVLNP